MTAAASSSSSSSFHSEKLLVPAATGGSVVSNANSPASTPVKQGDGVQKAAPSSSSTDSSVSSSNAQLLSEPLQTSNDEPLMYPVPLVRSHILRLSALVGHLSALALQHLPLDDEVKACGGGDGEPSRAMHLLLATEARASMALAVSNVWLTLVAASTLLSLRLPHSILLKMELNRRKYPVELCRGKAGKYTEYSDATGITKDHGQTTSVGDGTPSRPTGSKDADLDDACDLRLVERLTATIREFAEERLWSSYHRPRNLVLALLGELGELAELVQWNGDRDQHLVPEQLDKLSQELADVAIYLLRLVDVCGLTIDVGKARKGREGECDEYAGTE